MCLIEDCIAAVDVPVWCFPAQQQRLNSNTLIIIEVRAVLEFFQDGRVRVLNVGPIQSTAHVSQNRYIILSQTRAVDTL